MEQTEQLEQTERQQHLEQPPVVPVAETRPQQQNPRKVAAGWAAAASRKAKHEKLLNELRASMFDMVPPTKPVEDEVSKKSYHL